MPVENTWRLNERHYGALQGQSKRACSAEFGVEQVQKWRRGVHEPPPPWTAEMAESTIDRRYDVVPVPECESLSDCAARLQPFLDDELWPTMRRAVARAQSESEDAAATNERGAHQQELQAAPILRAPACTRCPARLPERGKIAVEQKQVSQVNNSSC